MTGKYNILEIKEKSGNELIIAFEVKPNDGSSFESSVNVPYNVTKADVLSRINNIAHNQIEYRAINKEKEKQDNANETKTEKDKDKLKKDIEGLQDIDFDITEQQ